MEFRTVLQPLQKAGLISHSTPVFMLGSCFTDSVGGRLERDMFDVMCNPFGTVYNPASIDAQIEFIVHGKTLTVDELIYENGLWHSFLTHSSLSAASPEVLLDNIGSAAESALKFLQRAGIAVITLGSAWIYRYNATNEIVSNCHKLPAAEFTRERLSVSGAVSHIENCISGLRSVAPDMTIILTVSPIRHLADGLNGNQLSKATLLLAADTVACRDEKVIYFPAYEAVIDDLRDYRFYEADMKHPSAVAVDYIYSLFSDSFFLPKTKDAALAARKFRHLTAHRPITSSEELQANLKTKIFHSAETLKARYPELAAAVDINIDKL